MKFYTAAAIQMNSQPNLEKNLEQAAELIDQAVIQGGKLIGLPENFAFLGDMEKRIEKAGDIAEKSEEFLKSQAREHRIYLLGGSFPVPAGNGKVYNRSLMLNPDGKVEATYNKVHLFDVEIPDGFTYRESNIVEAGQNEPPIYTSETLGSIGMSICYDLRFPELYRKLSGKGAEIIFVPSAFTEMTGKAHWESLLRARAIENTSYVVAPAQTGTHGEKRKTYGHAVIIDPWGDVLADAGVEKGFALAEISPDRLQQIRTQIPSLKHRVF